MDEEAFAYSLAGDFVPTVRGRKAFLPHALLPEITLDAVLEKLLQAHTNLGELRGIGRTLPNPYRFTRPLQRSEAVASSNIEGTYTSPSDLFLLEAGASEEGRQPDTREVFNYVAPWNTSWLAWRRFPFPCV